MDYNLFAIPFIVFIVGAFLLLFILTSTDDNSSDKGPSTTSDFNPSAIKEDADSFLTPVKISKGTFVKYPTDECIAPLTVETDGTNHYYIYLKTSLMGEETIFLSMHSV